LRASSREKNIPTIKKIKRMITPTTTKTSFRGYPAASKVIAIPRMKIVITPAKKRFSFAKLESLKGGMA
jgi:hypothetical protein